MGLFKDFQVKTYVQSAGEVHDLIMDLVLVYNGFKQLWA